MADKLTKFPKVQALIDDDDPTDRRPVPDFAGNDVSASGHDEPTQKRLSPLATNAELEKVLRKDHSQQRNTTEMPAQQRDEIRELKEAISSMSGEIERLHNTLADQPEASVVATRLQTEKPGSTTDTGTVNRILLVLNGEQRLKYPLFKESMTIGRSPENDIQISTQFVSRVHARITSDDSGAVIEDLNSRNGVVVNSRKVGRKKLRNGDLVALGKIQFKFIDLMEDNSGEGRA